jgi:TRAP-type C4-dicarboxylate transport system permease large subunit
VGLNLYVMQGSTGEPFRTIVAGSLPFAVLQVLVMFTIFLFPVIATWLPDGLY